MGLPKIIFNIAAAGLSLATADIQKVPGLVLTGATVSGKITIGQSKQVFSLLEAEAIGITEAENPFAYKHVKAFYDYAGNGAELWVMLISDATTVTTAVDKTEDLAAKLLNDANGRIRVLGVLRESTGTETITGGIDGDITTAVVKAQELAEDFADKYYPVRVILSGSKFSGSAQDLTDYSTSDFNRVSILLSNTDGEPEASIGLALGRLASTPVQRNIGRVADGAVESLNAYFTDGQTVGSKINSWESIHGKGYIFLRNFVGKAGFFFSDDPTLTSANDDYKTLANGFVMDKAVLVSYATLIEKINDEVPISETGNIQPAIVKSWQNDVENAVNTLMTSRGEISNFKATIDPNQDIVSTGELVIQLQVQPVGYAKTITANIGFTTQIQ